MTGELRGRLLQLVSLSAAAAMMVGCAGSEPEWHEAETSSGAYVAEFPVEPEHQTQPIPELGAEQAFTIAEDDEAAYTIIELPLDPGTEVDLDGGVEGAIMGALESLEQEVGAQGDFTEVSRDAGEFEGAETREAVADLEAGDQSARFRALVFVRDDALVQALYVGSSSDDYADMDHFFDSFELN